MNLNGILWYHFYHINALYFSENAKKIDILGIHVRQTVENYDLFYFVDSQIYY